jgi:predicted RNase H-like HicB family nuclease
MAAVTKTTETNEMSTTYHARFMLEDDIWVAEIAEIPEVHTFGRTLGKAREYIVDALALWLNEPADTVRHRVKFDIPELPDETRQLVQDAIGAREIAEGFAKTAGDLMTAAASALVNGMRLSIRDAAELLGISFQRVHQLLPEADEAKARVAQLRTQRPLAVKTLADQLNLPAPVRASFEKEMMDDTRGALAAVIVGAIVVGSLSRRR